MPRKNSQRSCRRKHEPSLLWGKVRESDVWDELREYATDENKETINNHYARSMMRNWGTFIGFRCDEETTKPPTKKKKEKKDRISHAYLTLNNKATHIRVKKKHLSDRPSFQIAFSSFTIIFVIIKLCTAKPRL